MRPLAPALALVACTSPAPDPDPDPDRVVLLAEADDADVVAAWVGTLGDDRVQVADDADDLSASDLVIHLEADAGRCGGCFRVDREDAGTVRVRGGDRLGRLYGASQVLEALGWRFHHPHRTWSPEAIALPDAPEGFGVDHAPEMARRGLHLHTLHPIEGLFDLWVPSDDGLARAEAVIDWVVRNRGNHLQWVALDDIIERPQAHEAWRAHTAEVLDMAHARGLTAGLGIQLYGRSNLQLAFDLLERPAAPEAQAAELGPRLDLVTDGLDFDLLHLTFGEFFSVEPERFVASVEQVYDEVQARQLGTELATALHVGDDMKVEYRGETLQYYFLATRADRPYTHWVHTVMFYNLFEDAGGAYHHDAFPDHRAYLVDALLAERPVGYFPESAYWVAFDNSVPQYFPLYVRSRWTDVDRLATLAADAGVPGLQDHVLFSSGWEWGYWQHDTAVLRGSYTHPASWCDPLRFELGAHGEVGAEVAELACELGDVQHARLLEERLTPWIAGYDAIMELGYTQDIVSQPRRTLPRELLTLTGEPLARFRADVAGLEAHAAEVAALDARLGALDLGDDRWLAEVADGFAIDRLRARFAWRLAQAALEALDGGDPGPALADAEGALEEARQVVDRRHADLHDPDPVRLLVRADNPTLYDFGYLLRADELCYWTRELEQTRNALYETEIPVDGCGL